MSTGQILGGVIGGVIGFFVGGPSGAYYGAMIGMTAGGIIDPQKIDGPHLQDRKVQMSTYGAAIPIIYGGDAGSGNVIWSADLQEHDVDASGKGGPTVTNHSYSVSCAILIGEGPIAGIRKIWADAKLVYDVSVDSTSSAPLSTGPFRGLPDHAASAASSLFASYFTFYPGTEDQLPDPTMEAALGVGNVPAYLGSCYIVFTDLPVTEYGNRIPNFRFETSDEAAPVAPDNAITYEPLKIYPWSGFIPTQSIGETQWAAGYGSSILSTTDYDTAKTYNATISHGLTGSPGASTEFIGYGTSTNAKASVFAGGADLLDDPQYVTYMMGVTTEFTHIDIVGVAPYTSVAWGGNMAQYGAGDNDGVIYWTQDARNGNNYLTQVSTSDPGGNYAFINNSGGYFSGQIYGSQIINMTATRLPAIPADVGGCPPGDPCLLGEPAQVPGHPNFCIACDGTVTPSTAITYEKITGAAKQLAAIEYRDGVLYQNGLGPVLLPDDPDYSNSAFWDAQVALAIAAGTLRSDVDAPVTVTEYAKGTGVAVDQVIAGEANTTLDAIVADICQRAGTPDGTYNVTELEGIPVQGYAIARQMPARAAILQTQQAFFWDFVESGREIKAVLRGADPVDEVIGLDDLGATESEEPIVAVVPTRSQEAEMPATLNLAYPVRKTGYETGTQRSRRLTTTSKQVMSLEIAVVMEDQKAADVVGALMYAAWTNRVARQWSTTRKWAHLEPTDVVTLDDGEFSYVVRITERSEEGGMIKWKGVDEQPAAYHPISSPGSVTGTSGDGYSQSVRFNGPSRLELIDGPIVLDSNDDAGIYAAAAGYRSPWPGEVAYRSIDGGTTWVNVKAMTNTATMGHATTVLGDFPGGNVVDEVNTVTVQIHSGSISTITLAQLMNGGNLAVLGNEYFQFLRADLVAENTFTASGLLRGRFGTEQHMGTHTATDRFVLFTPNVYRLPDTLSSLNAPAVWRGVTLNQTIDEANDIDFTNTGAGLKPLSVVHLNLAPDGAGALVAEWERRTRIAPTWRDFVDVPIGETSENYQVDLYDADGALVVSEGVTETRFVYGEALTGDPVPSVVGTFTYALRDIKIVGGDAIGIDRLSEKSTSTGQVHFVQCDADTGSMSLISTDDLGAYCHQWTSNGDEIYAVTETFYPITGYEKDSFVHRITRGVLDIAATYTATTPGDIHGIACDGTDVWIAEYYSGNLRKLDATTLASISTYAFDTNVLKLAYDAGSLWALTYADSLTHDLIEWDIATTTELRRFPVAVSNDFRIVGGLIFTTGDDVVVYDKATGDVVKTHAHLFGLTEFDTYIVCSDSFLPGRMRFIDASTGELSFTANASAIGYYVDVAGASGADHLYVTGILSTGHVIETDVVDMGTPPSTIPDYSGYSVRVRQLSSTVGPGFPATATNE